MGPLCESFGRLETDYNYLMINKSGYLIALAPSSINEHVPFTVKNNEKSGSFATLLSIITSLIKQITSEKSGQKYGRFVN